MKSLGTIMRTQRHDCDQHLGIVDFINHAVLLVDASRPRLCICHKLQRFHQCHNVFLALQSRERSSWGVGGGNIFLHGFHVAGVGKECVAGRTDLIGVNLAGRFQQLACQPVAVFLRERKAFDESPESVKCQCGHNSYFFCFWAQKYAVSPRRPNFFQKID